MQSKPLRVADPRSENKSGHYRLGERAMSAVAERRVLRMLATAPCHSPGLGNFHLFRCEPRAFVRAVAKRLRF